MSKHVLLLALSLALSIPVLASGQPPYQREVRFAIFQAAVRHDIPFSLLESLCIEESDLRWWVLGKDGEVGLCQVKLGTAEELLGARIAPWELIDPVVNTNLAAQYLKQCYSRYEIWKLALTCYNAGGYRPLSEMYALSRKGSYASNVLMRYRVLVLAQKFRQAMLMESLADDR